jgi:Na+/pantothenate symporter
MSRQLRLPKFRKLALVQLVLAIACAAIGFYFRTKTLLAGPPIGDLYAYNWDFQFIVFVVFWLPTVLLAVGVLLAIEHLALKPHYQAQQTEDAKHAP